MDAEERNAMVDAVWDVLFGDRPTVDNELTLYVLVDVLAGLVAAGTKAASNIDTLAATIGEAIAADAHRLRNACPEQDSPPRLRLVK
jgi:hypothetical protein